MWSRLRLRWEARTIESSLSDEELAGATRRIAKAIVQTLSNRAFQRPELAVGEPYASAREQRGFDRETLARYRENIVPELDSVRDEYLARGLWSTDLDDLYREPRHLADLRRLAIELGERAAAL